MTLDPLCRGPTRTTLATCAPLCPPTSNSSADDDKTPLNNWPQVTVGPERNPAHNNAMNEGKMEPKEGEHTSFSALSKSEEGPWWMRKGTPQNPQMNAWTSLVSALMMGDPWQSWLLSSPLLRDLYTGGKAQGSQKGIAIESIDWRLHGKLVMQGMRHTWGPFFSGNQ